MLRVVEKARRPLLALVAARNENIEMKLKMDKVGLAICQEGRPSGKQSDD